MSSALPVLIEPPPGCVDRAIIAAVVVIIFVALAADGANALVPSSIAASLEMAASAVCLLAFADRPSRQGRPAIVPTCFAATAMLGTLLPAVWPGPGYLGSIDIAMFGTSRLGGYIGLAIAGAAIAGTRVRVRVALGWIIGLGGLFTLTGLALTRPLWVADHHAILNGRFGGLMLNGNAAASVFGAIALLALTAGLDVAHSPTFYQLRVTALARVCVAGVVGVMAYGACILTQSRIASIAVTLLSLALILRQRRSRATLMLAAVLTAILGAVTLLVGGETLDRMDSLGRDFPERCEHYAFISRWLSEAPLFGHGVGTFRDYLQRHLDADHAADMWDWAVAHNFMLNALVEGGVLFAGALLTCWAAIGWSARRAKLPSDWRPIREGLLAALTLIIVCSSYDVALNVPAIAALASLLLGLWFGPALVLARPG